MSRLNRKAINLIKDIYNNGHMREWLKNEILSNHNYIFESKSNLVEYIKLILS